MLKWMIRRKLRAFDPDHPIGAGGTATSTFNSARDTAWVMTGPEGQR